jgi:hypothetical protein
MSSSPRRLLLLVLVMGLALPGHSFAAPWDLRNLLDKARGFISAFWAPSGNERASDRRQTPRPVPGGSGGAVFGNAGCEVLPGGLCKS